MAPKLGSNFRPLTLAIKKNARSLGQAQNTYKQNVVVVNTFITSVLSSSLPTISNYPKGWVDYTQAYEQSTAMALTWANEVIARLLSVPGDVQNYNSVIVQLLTDAQTQTQTLIGNPNDQAALASLAQDLNGLSSQLSLVIAFITGAISSLQKFQDQLPAMAQLLQTVATDAAKDNNIDQQQVNQYAADIQQLQNDISSLTAAIIALSIADGVALTIGIATTIALWPVGALVWFVMGPAVAAATTFIGLDAAKIVSDKQQIEAYQSTITGYTADIAALATLTQNFTNMVNQSAQVEAALQAILQEWQQLDSDVAQATSDIQAAIADKSSSNFAAVASDLSDAVSEWNAAYAQAGSLALDLQVNNAPLQYGMSAQQVETAMAGGTTMSVIEYYNSVGATLAQHRARRAH